MRDRKRAGFALFDRDFIMHMDSDRSMAEFFVMPKYRGQGAGGWMARALFDMYPGKWELGRNPKNLLSCGFWERVIDKYTCGEYTLTLAAPEHKYADGTLGDVFSFVSRPRPQYARARRNENKPSCSATCSCLSIARARNARERDELEQAVVPGNVFSFVSRPRR